MRIVFFGDSITDAARSREHQDNYLSPYGLGTGYVNSVATELVYQAPEEYQIYNTGISGHRVVDLYARIKKDVWNYSPDVVSILVGVNDVWHEIESGNGVALDRFERVYRMMIEDTLTALPKVKITLLEPFVQKGCATAEKFEQFKIVYEYAKVVKKLAEEYGLTFVELQKPLDDYAVKRKTDKALTDGVHPSRAGAKVIALEWLKAFNEKLKG